MAITAGQWRALTDCHGQHRRPVARSKHPALAFSPAGFRISLAYPAKSWLVVFTHPLCPSYRAHTYSRMAVRAHVPRAIKPHRTGQDRAALTPKRTVGGRPWVVSTCGLSCLVRVVNLHVCCCWRNLVWTRRTLRAQTPSEHEQWASTPFLVTRILFFCNSYPLVW